MDGHNEAWERVLAAVEADARRAEALLRPLPADDVVPGVPLIDEVDGAAGGVPAEWLLPALLPDAPLPPLSEMPPVPHELRERIEALRTQITGLQVELSQAMQELRHAARVVKVPAAVANSHQQPVFVDRRL